MMGLFFLVLIGITVYFISVTIDKKDGGARENPIETLKSRYARGEITHEQFEQMKKDIQ